MSLFENVVVMLRGSLTAQIISFAVLPILSRLYAPADFGRYQIFQSVVALLLLAASLRFEIAIVSADTDEYAFSLARLCVIINGGLAALTLLCCIAIRLSAPGVVEPLGAALWLLPPVLLAGGAFQTMTYLLLRFHAFRQASTARGVLALGNAVAGVALGALRATSIGLVLAELAGRMTAVFFSYARMIAKDSRYLLWRDRSYSLSHLLKKFREYPLISLPGALLDGVGGSMTPILMLGAFGAATAGQYALVERSIAMPVAVIAQAVSQVYVASFASSLRTDALQAGAMFKTIVLTHLKIGVLPAVVLFVIGRWAFRLVFGAQWTLAGEIAQLMAPLFLVSFIAAPVSMTLLMLNKQKLNFAWYVGRVTLVLSAWFAIFRFHVSPLPAIRIHVAVNASAYIVLLMAAYRSLPTAVDASKSGTK